MVGSCKKWLSFSVCGGEGEPLISEELKQRLWSREKELQEVVHPVSEMRKEKDRATPLTKTY